MKSKMVRFFRVFEVWSGFEVLFVGGYIFVCVLFWFIEGVCGLLYFTGFKGYFYFLSIVSLEVFGIIFRFSNLFEVFTELRKVIYVVFCCERILIKIS